MEELLKMAAELKENDGYKNMTGEYPEIPDGEYQANIDKVEHRTSKNGNDYINITTTIVDGDFTNQKIFVPFYFSEKSAKITIGKIMTLIASCGYEPTVEMFADYDSIATGLETLVNTVVTVKKETKGEYTNYSMKGDVE